MNKYFVVLLIFALSLPALGFSVLPFNSPRDNKPVNYNIVDNFEDADFLKAPNWWIFGNVQLSIVQNPAKGRYALSVKGTATDWYVGGVGVYFADPAKDLSKYSQIDLDVYGNGPTSGTLKIELYDDDNGNWQIEQDQNYNPLFDDRFTYEIKIDWDGWKHLSIPLSEFKDTNPNVGDNVWNPNFAGGSGGLLQMQLIAIASSKTGSVDFVLDNVGFSEGTKK